jgi:hypothetical protein
MSTTLPLKVNVESRAIDLGAKNLKNISEPIRVYRMGTDDAMQSELERDVIRDRVIAGMERAKAKGTKSGKAIGRPKVGAQAEAAIRASLLAGHGILKTAKLCGVSNGPVKRIKAALVTT